jgi:hypothetical protein
MTRNRSSSPLPPAALREFTKASQVDWKDGVPLLVLLRRVNRVASRLMGSDDQAKDAEGRVSRTFSERSFRHYQTLGCIDAPEKHGRLASYGFRHFLQALLVRKLLWQRLSSEQIIALLVGRPTAELERMLLGGVELTSRTGSDDGEADTSRPGSLEAWSRVRVIPGVEIHLSSELPRLRPGDLKQLVERMELVLRKHKS